MGIQLTGLLHCHQPFRDLFETAYIPLKVRYNGRVHDRALIPNLYVSNKDEKLVDYNQKITQECYEPSAAKGIYSRLPFNMSPSLLKDLWIRAPHVYNNIIESEKRSFDRFGGHSNAIGQASPNHIIMPLANAKDKLLHALWSIEEYEKHYGRFPEGMWLPEAAVDKKTLSVLADVGIKYVVLAPRQAKKVKPLFSSEHEWKSVEGGHIDISKPYKIYFEDTKKEIAVFFYDKSFSGDLGFPNKQTEWIYHNENNFTARWLNIWGELKHFAVDGETFGHHHKGKVDLLANSLNLIEKNPDIKLTNYGLFLEENPPKWDVEIIDYSSWSCEHGLVRWGKEFTHEGDHCREGSIGSQWRVEMRKAFDRLALDLDRIFLKHAGQYFHDPQLATENYGSVTSGKETFYEFFDKYGKSGLSDRKLEEAYKLIEMQKLKAHMFTSCAWFHDYIGRLEPLANFLSAYSAIKIAKHFEPRAKLEERFLHDPDKEKLNHDHHKHYEKAKIDMKAVYQDAKNVMEEYERTLQSVGSLAA